MDEQLFTAEVVAERVNMSLQAFYAACRNGDFPHVRIGKRIRVPESALQKWIEDQVGNNTKTQKVAGSLATVC